MAQPMVRRDNDGCINVCKRTVPLVGMLFIVVDCVP